MRKVPIAEFGCQSSGTTIRCCLPLRFNDLMFTQPRHPKSRVTGELRFSVDEIESSLRFGAT